MNLDGSGSDPELAEQVVKEIEAAGRETVLCFANVVDEADAAKVVQTALDAFGDLDVAVNNAGLWGGKWFEDKTLDDFHYFLDYRSLGTVNVSRAAWPSLRM